MSFKSYFITTAIPYVNSKPHIGHAQEFILADSIARYYKNQGHKVVFQSGTDDNATKNVLAARALSISVREFVDSNADKFERLLSSMDAKPDIFLRTSSNEHFKYVGRFIRALNNDDLYASTYSGLYCAGCEDFYNEQDLIEGLCPDHQKKPEQIEEHNVFFKLSKYQIQIIDLIESDTIKIVPAGKKKEILSFLNRGLSDISLSRSSPRTHGWGIPFPDHSDQTVYVWIDALINYLSGAPENWRDDVCKVHVIGKNVWKFHAIYWPALLLSAGLPLPNEIVIHGFLTNEGTKISMTSREFSSRGPDSNSRLMGQSCKKWDRRTLPMEIFRYHLDTFKREFSLQIRLKGPFLFSFPTQTLAMSVKSGCFRNVQPLFLLKKRVNLSKSHNDIFKV